MCLVFCYVNGLGTFNEKIFYIVFYLIRGQVSWFPHLKKVVYAR